jgi:anaerobic magnesium-protoporphyrin IX monomethyl ester cyclase
MKILIVAPKFNGAPFGFYQFPVGLGYISSTLKKAGHTVVCLNFNHTDEDYSSLVERTVRETSSEACLTGALSPFLPHVREIFAAARRGNPNIFNVAGGGVLSSDPEAMPSLIDINAGVIGEGEVTIIDLCDAFERGRDLNTVPGIVFPGKDGTAIRTVARDSIAPAALGLLPWPDYEGFGYGELMERHRTFDTYIHHMFDRPRSIDMISSRSCPYRCTFCFHPTGKIYRERPLDDFFAELEHLVDRYRITAVAITDELFSLKKARLFEFCARIKPYNLQWLVQLHVNVADPAVLEAMVDAGCTCISYGVESMSAPILLSMQKGSKVERIDAVMKSTYDNRIGIQGNLIFGDTAETLETANQSMSWWAHHMEYMINVNRLQVYPGSPDYIEAVRDGLITNRAKFIDDLDIDLNISQMNDDNLRMISLFAGTAQKSLLNVAQIVLFEEDHDELLTKKSYRIVWDCPRCDNRNDYRNVDVSGHPYRRSLRLTCRSCRSRADVENRTRIKPEDHPLWVENEATRVAAMKDLAEGRIESAVSQLVDLTRRSPWYHPANTALARHYLAKCEAAQKSAVSDEMEVVIQFGVAVLENPFEPDLHVDFARAMMRKGAYGMARIHLEQALKLDPSHRDATEASRSLREAVVDPAAHEIYFPSFSDAPPPTRKQPEGYVKPKREKEFPDIAAIELAVRDRLPATV